MIKKIFVGVLLAGVFGLLVFGAVNRTLAKNDDSEPLALSKNLSEDNGGGNFLGQNKNLSENKSSKNNVYQEAHGNAHRAGDCDGEQYSRGTEYRRSSNENGNGPGPAQGGQPDEMPGDGLGVGQAEVDEQVTLYGTVVSISSDLLVVELTDGSLLEVEGRVLSFLNEKGFSLSAGDELKITGFYEGESFEVIQITNDGSGETIRVRDQSGRPLWAGGRKNGGGNN